MTGRRSVQIRVVRSGWNEVWEGGVRSWEGGVRSWEGESGIRWVGGLRILNQGYKESAVVSYFSMR